MAKNKCCTKCGERKLLSAFRKRLISKDGLQTQCKKCRNNYDKEYQQTKRYKQAHREIGKKYRKTLIGYLHRCFSGIKRRCTNPECSAYKNYGGRGIKCSFKDVDEFINYIIDDLGYSTFEKLKGLQIDRIDNNGHYKSGNIRFVTAKVNMNNRRKQNEK